MMSNSGEHSPLEKASTVTMIITSLLLASVPVASLIVVGPPIMIAVVVAVLSVLAWLVLIAVHFF